MRQALGKGIGALIPTARERSRVGETPGPAAVADSTAVVAEATPRGHLVREIPAEAIAVNPRQPRGTFDESALADLARSIAAHGVLQPILVRPTSEGRFELVAGERRLRASRQVGLATVPALVKSVGEEDSLVLAVVENIQRADLSPLEEARAYRGLIDDFALTQDEVANRVGKSRPAIANALRLLSLPEDIQSEITAGRITAGHARALLALESDRARHALAHEIVQRKLSVRDAEAAAQRARTSPSDPATTSSDPDVRRLASDLSRALGTKVTIQTGKGGAGRIEIAFYSNDDLARVCDLLARSGRPTAAAATRG
ncbi:MAG TPA: ParB/RepB/Spo0J family partition protein [Candidatus Binatia bacterium]|nr:ParB/RepB/Spo0J family partition protein [Candidatus Binatia bacterium]